MNVGTHKNWIAYCQVELESVRPILSKRGYTLCEQQPHLLGERFLQQAVSTTSGRKLILLATAEDGREIVIKATRDKAGKAEIEHERNCRQVLNDIDFAGSVFHTPKEIDYFTADQFLISIQEFITQTTSFLDRPIAEQFALALSAFKAQESAHATTYKHRKLIQRTYHIRDSHAYLENFSIYSSQIQAVFQDDEKLHQLLQEAADLLQLNHLTVDQYGSFLTHTDFVPHNFRIANNTIFLLDHSSLTFGNKHEGWARFLNFMVLYNQPLEQAFLTYMYDNRAPEEQLSLKLMRVYRLGEIIWYYTDKLVASSGDLLTLNTARVYFWKEVLKFVLSDQPVPSDIITDYQNKRDSLRSEDEKKRQQGLH